MAAIDFPSNPTAYPVESPWTDPLGNRWYYTASKLKWALLGVTNIIDNTVIDGSTNPVSGNAVFDAITAKNALATPFTPVGSIAATNVQAAIAELDAEKASQVTGSVGRYAGMIAAGPPSVGTYLAGDWVQTQNGDGIWTCREGGTPGRWVNAALANSSRLGPVAQKNDWHMIARIPGNLSATGFGFAINNRMNAAPFPVHQDSAISSVRFEVLTGSHPSDTTAAISVAIYDDFQGVPGKRLWASADIPFGAGTQGLKYAEVNPPIKGGRWVWVVFRSKNVFTASGTLRAIDSTPYQIQTSLFDSTFNWTEQNPVCLNCDTALGATLPVRWPETPLLNRVGGKFPLVAFNFAANSDRNDPYRYEPDRAPVLLPSATASAYQEPSCHYWPNQPEDRRYTLYCSGGWDAGQHIEWFSAPTVDGPWTYRGSFGDGGRGNIYAENGVVYHYMGSNSGVPGAPVICRSGTTPELLAASVPVTVLTGIQANNPGMNYPYANSQMIKRGPNDYLMMWEGLDLLSVSPTIWRSGWATGTSPTGPFTVQGWLPSVQQTITGRDGHYSAGSVVKVGSTYKMIYHAADYGNLPSEIFIATSTNLTNWTPDPLWVVRRDHPREYDQVADPSIFIDPIGGKTYLFWSAVENDTGTGCIMRSNPNKMDIAGLLGI